MLRNLHPADYNPARIKKFDKDFAREPYFKDIKFRVKIRDIHNVERKHCMNNVVFGYVNKKRYPIHMLIYYGSEKKVKSIMILSTILLTHSCMIVCSTAEESIFVAIVYRILVQQKYYKVVLMTALKYMVNK